MKHFKTISEFHQFRDLPKPLHPLLSVVNVEEVKHLHSDEPMSLVFDFYLIAVKRVSTNMKVKYGQQPFDFTEGTMSFMAPAQTISFSLAGKEEVKQSGWMLLIHPDFLWNTPLTKTIRHYDFWGYSLHEVLFLSEKEEAVVASIIRNIEQEYHTNIDKFSKQIIISQIESLLSYAERFYNRQFITREKGNHHILERLEDLLTDYFNNDDLVSRGLPTVQLIDEQLHLSPKYLSNLLRVLAGQNTQQYIHDKLVEKAKEKLSGTNLTVSEIAYELGFEHLQPFSKLFKTKTTISPLKYRQSFN